MMFPFKRIPRHYNKTIKSILQSYTIRLRTNTIIPNASQTLSREVGCICRATSASLTRLGIVLREPSSKLISFITMPDDHCLFAELSTTSSLLRYDAISVAQFSNRSLTWSWRCSSVRIRYRDCRALSEGMGNLLRLCDSTPSCTQLVRGVELVICQIYTQCNLILRPSVSIGALERILYKCRLFHIARDNVQSVILF